MCKHLKKEILNTIPATEILKTPGFMFLTNYPLCNIPLGTRHFYLESSLRPKAVKRFKFCVFFCFLELKKETE
jgi:hypothetical protein